MFCAKSSTGDYHNEMNIQHFMEWWRTKLLPNIPDHSIIVVDNASYHNCVVEKIPTKSSWKTEMQTWLENHGISYDSMDLKSDLFNKTIAAQPKSVYLTDVEAEARGHEVIRLPVAHCELNPIELAWAHVKEHVRTKNKQYTMAEIEQLTPAGISAVTPDLWKKYVEHVRIIEDKYFEQDGLIEDVVEDCLEQFGREDSDDDDSDIDSDIDDDDTCKLFVPHDQRRSDTLDLVYNEFTLNCILDISLILKLPILE